MGSWLPLGGITVLISERMGRPVAQDAWLPDADPGVVGLVAGIRRFSMVDGPGLRSAVLLRGCPMRCIWCHQPAYRPLLPHDEQNPAGLTNAEGRQLCQDQAASLTPPAGQRRSAAEVMAQLGRDHTLYVSTGGGITIGGGEPLYQPEFTAALLRAARGRGWHTAIDTSGHAATALFEELLPLADLVIFDLKETDLQLHQRWTGTRLEPVIRNLVRAAVSCSDLWVRLPVVPFANDRDDHWQQAGSLLADLPGPPVVHLMPYYFCPNGMVRATDAEGSGQLLGPTESRLTEIDALLSSYGLVVSRP